MLYFIPYNINFNFILFKSIPYNFIHLYYINLISFFQLIIIIFIIILIITLIHIITI